jgi:predicted nucleotidyltransferase component of viral defense system
MSSIVRKNIVASIQARLKNVSKAEGVNFDYMLSRYGIERFLYRLSCSVYKNRFVLKGASLFNVWLGPSFRTTRDADFLCNGNSDPDNLVQLLRQQEGKSQGMANKRKFMQELL